MYNPIISVCKVLPDAWRNRHLLLDPSPQDLAQGYIRFFEPDVFVEAEQGPQLSMWRFRIYGGVDFSGDPNVYSASSLAIAVTSGVQK